MKDEEIEMCKVEWYDAQICAGEFCKDDVSEVVKEKLPTVETCGFMVEETEYLIVVARDRLSSNIFRDMIIIPKKFIVNLQMLRRYFRPKKAD